MISDSADAIHCKRHLLGVFSVNRCTGVRYRLLRVSESDYACASDYDYGENLSVVQWTRLSSEIIEIWK